jgi:hypothetical protein
MALCRILGVTLSVRRYTKGKMTRPEKVTGFDELPGPTDKFPFPALDREVPVPINCLTSGQICLVNWNGNYILYENIKLTPAKHWAHLLWVKENFEFYDAYITGWVRAGHDEGQREASALVEMTAQTTKWI